jgi:hypothetical protein
MGGIVTSYIDIILAMTQQLGRSLPVYPAFAKPGPASAGQAQGVPA